MGTATPIVCSDKLCPEKFCNVLQSSFTVKFNNCMSVKKKV